MCLNQLRPHACPTTRGVCLYLYQCSGVHHLRLLIHADHESGIGIGMSAYILEKIQGFVREIQGFGAEGLTARRRFFLGDDVAHEIAISIENHIFT